MAEQESWGEAPKGMETPVKRSRFPGWLMFCCGGCLLLVVVVAGTFGCVGYNVSQWDDPVKERERLARVLPFDEPLDELEFVQGWHWFLDAYILRDPDTDEDGPDRAHSVAFLHFEDAQEAAQLRAQMLDVEDSRQVGSGVREDVERVTIEVQGRGLEGVRYALRAGQEPREGEMPLAPEVLDALGMRSGQVVELDVTPSGVEGVLFARLFRAGGEAEPISDETVRELLAPFHVGPDR